MDTLVTMTGWVGSPVDFRITRNQVSCASFRLASTPRFRRADEWVAHPTTWLTITAFRQLAENLHGCLAKGEPVVVAGRLRTQNWVDADGEPHERIVLEASTVGHDLSLGQAAFRRSTTAAAEEATELSAEGGEHDGARPGGEGAARAGAA